MTEYERKLFNGRCPYDDVPCGIDISCNECEKEAEERRYMEEVANDKN